MTVIRILPVGEVAIDLIEYLGVALESEFSAPCEIVSTPFDLEPSFHPQRRQFSSTDILRRMQPHATADSGPMLGVTSGDLYIPILTFVFGEAELNGRCAVVSTHRLHQEFYGLAADFALLGERLVKEAVHELGHTRGLVHCEDYRCAMSAAHSVERIDLKGATLCDDCRRQSGR